MKLMVVDDSNIIRSRIARIALQPALRGLHIVGLARNGLEAIALMEKTHPDVVTLDLTMPEMDGVTCVGELIRRDPELNILIVSALSDKATAIEALKRGAKGFIYKPFTDAQLVSALQEVVT
ncbi:MAG: response regulator [Spongiibacteraceae bacterium]